LTIRSIAELAESLGVHAAANCPYASVGKSEMAHSNMPATESNEVAALTSQVGCNRHGWPTQPGHIEDAVAIEYESILG
jgi:hypothetical protein